MATWQVDFDLIGELPRMLDIDSLNCLKSAFGEYPSWSADVRQFGDSDETCIEILTERDLIEEIGVRLDLRDLKLCDVNAICAFAKANHLTILFESKEYQPTLDSIKTIIKASSAAQFVKDPIGFFESLSN